MAIFVPRFLRQLRDVLLSSPADGEVLAYDDADGKWKNSAAAGGGVTDHGALTGLADDGHPQYTTTAEAQALVDVHVSDAADAHDASAVSVVPFGTIAATQVQAALEEIVAEAVSDLGPAVILAPTSSARNVIVPTAGTVIATVTRAHAAQSVNLAEWQLSSAALAWGLSKGGHEILTDLAAPADGDVPTGQRWQWYDDAAGMPLIKFTQRDSAGTLFKGRALSSNYDNGSVRIAAEAGADYALRVLGAPDEAFGEAAFVVENSAEEYVFTAHSTGTAIVWGAATPSMQFYLQGADLATEINYYSFFANLVGAAREFAIYDGNAGAGAGGYPIHIKPDLAPAGGLAQRIRLGIAQYYDARATVEIASQGNEGRPTLIVRCAAIPADSDLVALVVGDYPAAVVGGVKKNGHYYTRKIAAPADADLSANDLAWWYDSTNGAAKWMAKGKTADGTVVTWTIPSGVVALQSAIDAHLADTADAHDASAVSFSPTGTIASTDVQSAIAEVASEAGGGGAPTDASYVTVNAEAGLSAETLYTALKLDDFAAPDDNTDLNVSITKHGLTPKLSNVASEYLSGTGVFSVPAGGGGGGSTDVQVFDASDSWTKPADAVSVRVICIGAGGGGAGGASSVVTAKTGGSGGGGGAVSTADFQASDLGSPITVTVGAAGTGGAGGAAGAGADGVAGGDGGLSSFGTQLGAGGGGGGIGGRVSTNSLGGGGGSTVNSAVSSTAGAPASVTAIGGQGSTGVAGASGTNSEWGGASGGGNRTASGACDGGSSIVAGPGGGGGGRVTAGNVGVLGHAGGDNQSYTAGGGPAGGAAGSPGVNGTNGSTTPTPHCGQGASGGGGGTGAAGGTGGNGGIGAGGGGGGTSSHATSSDAGGTGGAGGAGRVIVITQVSP